MLCTPANGVGNSLEATKSASKLDLDAACFIAGTLVCTEDGYRNIEDIAVGDYVWAWDEETGDVALKPVVETYVHEKSTLVHIFAGGEEITATSEHPFYSPGQGWTAAAELQTGDVLLLLNGDYVIVDQVHQELLDTPVQVFNFQVQDFHTYFVADAGILVHNFCNKLPEDLTPDGSGRSGAFNKAKQDLGIPKSQQPEMVLPNVNRQGKVVPGRVYDYGGGKQIRDDVAGHVFSDGTILGRHFNTTIGHYFY